MYNCNYCNYKTNKLCNFKKHITTKKHQNNVILDKRKKLIRMDTNGLSNATNGLSNATNGHEINLEDENDNENNINTPNCNILTKIDQENIILDKLQKGKKHKNYDCIYCNTHIKEKKYLRKHLINNCLSVDSKLKDKLIEKHNSRKNTKHKIPIINNKNKCTTITNKNSNNNITNNSNNTNTTNNTQNNLTINVSGMTEMNYVANETIDHLSKEERLNLLKSPLRIVELLCQSIYKNKANQNIYLHNKRKNTYKYLDNNTKKIVVGTKDSIIKGICNQNMYHIDNLFSDLQNEISAYTKKVIKNLLNKYYIEDEPQFNKFLEREVLNQIDQIGNLSKLRIENIIRVKKNGKIHYYLKEEDEDEDEDVDEITYIAEDTEPEPETEVEDNNTNITLEEILNV